MEILRNMWSEIVQVFSPLCRRSHKGSTGCGEGLGERPSPGVPGQNTQNSHKHAKLSLKLGQKARPGPANIREAMLAAPLFCSELSKF